MATSQATPEKKRYITAVQTGRRKLGMRDEEYRAFLSGISNGRTESTRALTMPELKQALTELRKDGFSPKAQPQYKKIASLWFAMHDAGIVRDKGKKAMDAYITRITKLPPAKCGPAEYQRVIETMKKWAGRVESTEAYQRLQRLFGELETENVMVQ